MTRSFWLGLGFLWLTGCVHQHHMSHPVGMPPGQAKKVAHVHAEGCGHVYLDGVWISVSTGTSGHSHDKGRKH